jgi:hypothetical protein
MRHRSPTVRVAVVVAALAVGGLLLPATPTGPAAAVSDVGTPLPPGWELCVLQGVGAPVTNANVADLDEWQAVEGGSTDNTAAFNPYNTRGTTDLNGVALPETMSANGFPAFATWAAGCAATVATLEQTNMWAIDIALRSGNVSPPAAFLATVDQTQWCAPSNGQPCYLAEISGASGNSDGSGSTATNGVPAVLIASSALAVYGDVHNDLNGYQLAAAAVASDETAHAVLSQSLVTSDATLARTQDAAAAVEQRLGKFGVAEYMTGSLFEGSVFLGGTNAAAQSRNGEAATQYTRATAAGLVSRSQAAQASVAAAQAARDGVARQLQAATATLAADAAAENRALVTLLADETTLQNAGACTAVPSVATLADDPGRTATGPESSTSTTGSVSTSASTSGPGSGSGPSTTTTGPAAATTTVPSSTTTTAASSTTTTSSTSTTTTTTQAGGSNGPSVLGGGGGGTPTPTSPGGAQGTTTSTTTAPSTTTTAFPPTTTTAGRAAASSTTTTTSSASGAAGPEVANPAGISLLQGCVAAFAPGTNA